MADPTPKKPAVVDTTKWFYFTMLFLVVDYARPQDLIPGLGAIRPGLLVMLVLVFYLIKHRKLIPKGIRQIRMVWYFIGLLAIYVPFAVNGFYAYTTFEGMLNYMPFVLSVLVCVNSIERIRTFMKVYVGIMIYVAIYGLMHAGMGSGNYFLDENDLSLYIDMVLPFCYFLFLAEKKKTKLYYAGALVIGLLAVVISFSRGGFVGLVLMFFIVWMVSPRKMLTLVVIAVLGAGVYFYAGAQYRSEMSTVTDTKESTASARLKSWATAWDMFLANPLGVGGNNFPVRFMEYQGDRFDRGMWGRVAHSLWFTVIPETGIIGIIIFLRLLIYNVKGSLSIKIKKKDPSEEENYLNLLSVAFIASLVGFLAAASFISVLYYPHYWYLTAMIAAVARVSQLVRDASAPVPAATATKRKLTPSVA